MKAIVYTRYAGPEVLQLKDVPIPRPKDNEVLIKVFAASINDWDWGLLHGDFINRMLNGFFKPRRQILGSDVAGRIEAVGKDVSRFKIGDEVYGDLSGKWGGFAEYVCADEKALALKAPSMSFEDAAAIPQAAMLAVQGLIDEGKLQYGQKLLINGAGGGVGTFGIQLARPFDAEITVVDRQEKHEMLRALGATRMIDYRKEDFTLGKKQYDLILDVKTNRNPLKYLKALTPKGVYATVGGDLARLLQAFLLSIVLPLFSRKKVIVVALQVNKDLGYINELFEAGKIKTIIDGPYKLEELPKAMEHFGRAQHKGKIVLTISS